MYISEPSWSLEWIYSLVDVFRKRTLIIFFTCRFRSTVGWPLAMFRPSRSPRFVAQVFQTSSSQHDWKAYLRFVLDQIPSCAENEARREGPRRMCSSLNGAAELNKKFYHRNIFTGRGGRDGVAEVERIGTALTWNEPINTTGLSRFPPDSQQIPNRLTQNNETRVETASSQSPLVCGQTTSQCPFSKVGVRLCVGGALRKLSQQSHEEGGTLYQQQHLKHLCACEFHNIFF